MSGLQAQKRPLMLAALNGLSVARVPGREDGRHDATRVPIDERVSPGLAPRFQKALSAQTRQCCLPHGLILSTEED